MKTYIHVWLVFFFLALLAYSLFSFSLTDPNLVISQQESYWQFQEWMWQTFFHNRQLLAGAYASLVFALFGSYLVLLSLLRRAAPSDGPINHVRTIVIYALLISPLFISYNALSHDVFNYMFNARMVLKYQANPHVKTATDFVYFDDWTRFMHNTHTPAPYGYGWTAISLMPSFAGAQRFLPTWLLFRALSVVGLLGAYVVLQQLSWRVQNRSLTHFELSLFFLNPLVLIELVGNMHNDVWMILPAGAALLALVAAGKQGGVRRVGYWMLSAALLALSVSVKYATLALVPLWVLVLFGQVKAAQLVGKLHGRFALPKQFAQTIIAGVEQRLVAYAPTMASLLLFLPLFTERSQRFLPWYLVWSLFWIPLVTWKFWKQAVLVFSLTSLLRYLPWLWEGGYTVVVTQQERLITWGLALVLLVLVTGRDRHRFTYRKSASKTTLRRIE